MNKFFGIFVVAAFLVSNINCGGPVANPCASVFALMESLSSYPRNEFVQAFIGLDGTETYLRDIALSVLMGDWSGPNYQASDVTVQQQLSNYAFSNPQFGLGCIVQYNFP